MDDHVVLFSSRKRARPSANEQHPAAQKTVKYTPQAAPEQSQQLDNALESTFESLGLNAWLLGVLQSLDIKQPTRAWGHVPNTSFTHCLTQPCKHHAYHQFCKATTSSASRRPAAAKQQRLRSQFCRPSLPIDMACFAL